ncbi:phosphoserine phosphatase SerB [Jannaschia rubra]|uniref:phosphoserine phosphatase SerB n=1 Tax=Jannaschia rubra TaxID=282197 RepID=UPI00249283D8|nr:phosphoserine phosphatase SerB [Jannaschia rubra]
MFTTVLTCSPDRPRIDATLMEALRNGWGGGSARWLARGVAAEFDMDRLPDTLEATRADMDAMGVDLNVLATQERRKRLLLADMDSTMIRQECIDELADEAGVGAHVAAITARAMNGEVDFEGALRERVALLAGLNATVIDRVLQDRITLMPGGRTLVATMKAQGATAALVSGGFTAFTDAVAAKLGFDWSRANTLLVEDGVLTGAVAEPILGRQAKVDALVQLCADLRIAEEDAIAVGDGANDLGMLGRAGLGVALHAKPAVQAQAGCRINHGDLTALLYLQGYHEDDFVA